MRHDARQSLENFTKPATNAFRFWISFWPVAPWFGVEWRFADVARKGFGSLPTPLTGSGTTDGRTPKAAPTEVAQKALEIELRAAQEIVEAAADAAPAEAPAAERTEEAIEAIMEPAEAAPEATEPESPPVVEPETGVAEAAAKNLELELESGDGTPEKPKGLLKTPPKTVDDLKLIKGIGPGLERQLNGLGIYTFRQIAKFSDQDLAWVDANLTAFKGRCFRDDWIGQAKAQLD